MFDYHIIMPLGFSSLLLDHHTGNTRTRHDELCSIVHSCHIAKEHLLDGPIDRRQSESDRAILLVDGEHQSRLRSIRSSSGPGRNVDVVFSAVGLIGADLGSGIGRFEEERLLLVNLLRDKRGVLR